MDARGVTKERIDLTREREWARRAIRWYRVDTGHSPVADSLYRVVRAHAQVDGSAVATAKLRQSLSQELSRDDATYLKENLHSGALQDFRREFVEATRKTPDREVRQRLKSLYDANVRNRKGTN